MNFHLYATTDGFEAEDYSPTSSLLSTVPTSHTSRSRRSHRSVKRVYNNIRYRCRYIKEKLHRSFRSHNHAIEQQDTVCDQFDFPYPSPLTFNFANMQYEAAHVVQNDDDDWYTTLASTLRRGYVEYDTFS